MIKGLILTSLLLLSACAIRKDLETPFANPTSKPKVQDVANNVTQGTKFCSPDAQGKFNASAITTQTGVLNDGSAWAEGGGCVLRPIREVWAVINNLEAMKFEDVDRFEYKRTLRPKPEFTHLYEITYFKSTPIGTIDWTINWYHAIEGNFESPTRVTIDYQRVRGTSNIPIWRGGIVLTKVNDSVTSVAIRNEFEARQTTQENIDSARDALTEMIGHMRNGKPDWKRLNLGFKADAGAADATVGGKVASVFCAKDKNGHYPEDAEVGSTVEDGVSQTRVTGCLLKPITDVESALKNHGLNHWKNATRVQVTPVSATEDSVTYEQPGWLWGWTRWTMSWTYEKTIDQMTVSYNIDPATEDFPVWNGKITLKEIEPGVTAIQIEDHLLTDKASESLLKNQELSIGLFNSLKK